MAISDEIRDLGAAWVDAELAAPPPPAATARDEEQTS
jgi:hypothetical protein